MLICLGQDVKLYNAVEQAKAQVEEQIKAIMKRKWHFVAKHLVKSGPSFYYSEDACRKRYATLELHSSPSPPRCAAHEVDIAQDQLSPEIDIARMNRLTDALRPMTSAKPRMFCNEETADDEAGFSDTSDDYMSDHDSIAPADSSSQYGIDRQTWIGR
jgi:hypothetical protein